jgi:8-oxo-dGTP diphosphatase
MSTQAYDHPALTADVVVLALSEEDIEVLLIQRGKPPFQGEWAFPGGFVNIGESPQSAASRELEEETGIQNVRLEQLRAFGDPGRDPRGHTVTVAYLAVIGASAPLQGEAGSDAVQVRWWSVDDLPVLAFDHADILTYALQMLRSKLTSACTTSDADALLPAELSLGDMRSAWRTIAERLEREEIP